MRCTWKSVATRVFVVQLREHLRAPATMAFTEASLIIIYALFI
jgi:hypothetical protein